MWKARTKTVPVVTAALGIVTKGLDQNLQLTQGHTSVIELQKITIMSTAHNIQQLLG